MKKLFTVNLIFCFLFAQVPVQALVSPITPARTQTAVTAPLQKAVNDTNNEDLFNILKQIVDAMYKGQTEIAGADDAAYEPNERLTEQEQDAMAEFNRYYVASLLAEVMTDVNGNASHSGRTAQLQTIAAKLLPVIFDFLSDELPTIEVRFQGTSSRLPNGDSAQEKTIEFAGEQFKELIEQGKGEDATHVAIAVAQTYLDHPQSNDLKDLLVDWVYDEDGKYTPVILPILGRMFLKSNPNLLVDIILAGDAGDGVGTQLLGMIPGVSSGVEAANGSDIFHKNISGSYYQGPSERKNLRNAWLDFGKEWGQAAQCNQVAEKALNWVVKKLLRNHDSYRRNPGGVPSIVGNVPSGAGSHNPIYPFLFGAFSTGYHENLSTQAAKELLHTWYKMLSSGAHGAYLLDQYTARYFKNVVALGYNRLDGTRSPDNLTLNAGDHYQCSADQVQQNEGKVGDMVCQYSSPDPGNDTPRDVVAVAQTVALTADIILAVVGIVEGIASIARLAQAGVKMLKAARVSSRIAKSVKLINPEAAEGYIRVASQRIARVKGWNEATMEKLIKNAIKKYNGEFKPVEGRASELLSDGNGARPSENISPRHEQVNGASATENRARPQNEQVNGNNRASAQDRPSAQNRPQNTDRPQNEQVNENNGASAPDRPSAQNGRQSRPQNRRNRFNNRRPRQNQTIADRRQQNRPRSGRVSEETVAEVISEHTPVAAATRFRLSVACSMSSMRGRVHPVDAVKMISGSVEAVDLSVMQALHQDADILKAFKELVRQGKINGQAAKKVERFLNQSHIRFYLNGNVNCQSCNVVQIGNLLNLARNNPRVIEALHQFEKAAMADDAILEKLLKFKVKPIGTQNGAHRVSVLLNNAGIRTFDPAVSTMVDQKNILKEVLRNHLQLLENPTDLDVRAFVLPRMGYTKQIHVVRGGKAVGGWEIEIIPDRYPSLSNSTNVNYGNFWADMVGNQITSSGTGFDVKPVSADITESRIAQNLAQDIASALKENNIHPDEIKSIYHRHKATELPTTGRGVPHDHITLELKGNDLREINYQVHFDPGTVPAGDIAKFAEANPSVFEFNPHQEKAFLQMIGEQYNRLP